MQENFIPKNENTETINRRLLEQAMYVINSMWDKAVKDIDELPLDVDLSYQEWLKDLEKNKINYAKILFQNCKITTGEEKLDSAIALKRLLKLLSYEDGRIILNELFTTTEAIDEIINQAKPVAKKERTRLQNVIYAIQATVDKLLRRDDDYDKGLR